MTNTAIQWACGKPNGCFTPRRSLFGSVIVVMGRVAEQHWDLDQELSGLEPWDAVAALNDVLDGDGDDPADV